MECGVVSKQGQVRDRNEDSYLVDSRDELDILVVADGMGGHQDGDMASFLAVEVIDNYNFNSSNLLEEIKNSIEKANGKILRESREKIGPCNMGTTLTLGIIKDRILTVGHIGDSRAYLFRDNNLEQITSDHSFVGELLRKNLINKEEARNHPKKNLLTKALGLEEGIEVDSFKLELKASDVLLLCSDGLTNMVADQKIKEVLAADIGVQDKADKLAKMANQAGGYDNITALIYQSN